MHGHAPLPIAAHAIVISHHLLSQQPLPTTPSPQHTPRLLPQPLPTLPRPTQTRHLALALLFLPLVLLLIQIIKRQFLPRRDIPNREKRQIIHPVIMLVVADGVLPAIRLAAMIHELGRPAHELAVNDVDVLLREAFGFLVLVKGEEVRRFAGRARGFAAGGFGVGDDFAAVCVDELAWEGKLAQELGGREGGGGGTHEEILVAAETPAAAAGLEDGELDSATELYVLGGLVSFGWLEDGRHSRTLFRQSGPHLQLSLHSYIGWRESR